MNTTELYREEACCGCGACAAKCPKEAISIKVNEFGFKYPYIDSSLCIDCKACKKVCSFNDDKKTNNYKCYAGGVQDENLLMKSASGGIFSAIASQFIEMGGYVCGSSSFFENGIMRVEHIIINDLENLYKLQGSKYVQSDTVDCFREIGKLLKNGSKVLFSGTPCQVDAIKSLYGRYSGTLLFTIDIICHGVPSQSFLNGYLKEYQKRNKQELIYFDFRNKKYGWGLTGIAKFMNGIEETVTPEKSSYYRYFLDGEIYRENCYKCPYANLNRVGDITIGDYWGVEKYSPELLNKGTLSESKGISCLLINNTVGEKMLGDYGKKLVVYPVEISKVMIVNTQLKEPAKHSEKRRKLLKKFKDNGYSSIEKFFIREILWAKTKNIIKKLLRKN